MNEFEKFACSLTTGDGDEIGSGIIVQIDLEELLKHPSSLKKKVHDKLSAQEECYALITAHSNVYEVGDSEFEMPELLVLKYLRNRKIVLVNSDDLKTIDETCVSCCAVSCCGMDSMLRMPQPPLNKVKRLQFAMRAHDRKCNIGYDFVVVFLKAESVRQWFSSNPPKLSLAGCSCLPGILQDRSLEVYMCWRSEGGSVERENVGIRTADLQSQPQVQGLGDEISRFEKYQSLQYIQEGEGGPGKSHIGAPIVLHNTRTGASHLIGINTKNGVTTLYGILKLMKGGVVPFLAAMRHPLANARALKPSRWKDYLLPHVDLHIQSLDAELRDQFVVDLLHYLLEKRAGATVVKFPSSEDTDSVVAGLNVLTEILKKLKNMQNVQQCCDGVKCFREFCSTDNDLNKWLQQFANQPDNPPFEVMVPNIFECFEALLNYKGVVIEALETNIELLIKIATHEHYESDSVVNRCFKNILLKEREYLRGTTAAYKTPMQATT